MNHWMEISIFCTNGGEESYCWHAVTSAGNVWSFIAYEIPQTWNVFCQSQNIYLYNRKIDIVHLFLVIDIGQYRWRKSNNKKKSLELSFTFNKAKISNTIFQIHCSININEIHNFKHFSYNTCDIFYCKPQSYIMDF